MILILIAIIASIVAGIALMNIGEYDNFFQSFFGLLLVLAGGVTGIVYAFSAWSWFAADYKTAIINREYGTNYTREEIFWASDSIETIRELDRKRIEVNGDVMRDKSDNK